MKILALEVRDTATFIPVAAVQMTDANEAQRYLLRRCGYDLTHKPLAIVLFRMNGDGYAYSDPYSWGGRTMQMAHQHILEHFDELADGDVIDVEYLLGERDAPKPSERLTVPL